MVEDLLVLLDRRRVLQVPSDLASQMLRSFRYPFAGTDLNGLDDDSAPAFGHDLEFTIEIFLQRFQLAECQVPRRVGEPDLQRDRSPIGAELHIGRPYDDSLETVHWCGPL